MRYMRIRKTKKASFNKVETNTSKKFLEGDSGPTSHHCGRAE